MSHVIQNISVMTTICAALATFAIMESVSVDVGEKVFYVTRAMRHAMNAAITCSA